MKRAIAVFLVLATVFLVLLIPVSAIDKGYYFDKYEVTPFASFTPAYASQAFICYSFLPEGTYSLEFIFYPEVVANGLMFNLYVSTLYVDYYYFEGSNDFGITSCLRCDFVQDGDAKIGNQSLSGSVNSSILSLEDFTILISESPILQYVESIVVTPCFTIDDQLDYFVGDICRGMFELSGINLITVILVALGIVAAPVLLWFGYRYVKRKVVTSFRKGKV